MDIADVEKVIADVRALADRWNSATTVGVITGDERPDLISRSYAEQLYAVLEGDS